MQRTNLVQLSQQLQSEIDTALIDNQHANAEVKIYLLIRIFQENLRQYVVSLAMEANLDDDDCNKIAYGLNGVNFITNPDFFQLDYEQRISFIESVRVLEYLEDILLNLQNRLPEERNIRIPCTKIHYAQISFYALLNYLHKRNHFDKNTVGFFNIFFESLFPCFPKEIQQRDLVGCKKSYVNSIYGSTWYERFIYQLCKNDIDTSHITSGNYSTLLPQYLGLELSDIEKYCVIENTWNGFKKHEKLLLGEAFIKLMVSQAKQGCTAAAYWLVKQSASSKNTIFILPLNKFNFQTRFAIIMNAFAFPNIDSFPNHPGYKVFRKLFTDFISKFLNIKHIELCFHALNSNTEEIQIQLSSPRLWFIDALNKLCVDSRFDSVKLNECIIELKLTQAKMAKMIMSDASCNPLFIKLWERDGKQQLQFAENFSQAEIAKNACLFSEICEDDGEDTLLHQLPTEIFVRIAIETRLSFFHTPLEAQHIVYENFNHESSDSDFEISIKSSQKK